MGEHTSARDNHLKETRREMARKTHFFLPPPVVSPQGDFCACSLALPLDYTYPYPCIIKDKHQQGTALTTTNITTTPEFFHKKSLATTMQTDKLKLNDRQEARSNLVETMKNLKLQATTTIKYLSTPLFSLSMLEDS